MEELIKFRRLADATTENEFASLMPRIIGAVGKETLISSLFYHFQKHLNDPIEHAKLQALNQEIAVINNHSLILSPQIDKVSESIINNIASYLDLKSYSHFETCNRTIFIAARSPYQVKTASSGPGINCYIRYCNENIIVFDHTKFIRLDSLKFDPWSDTMEKWAKLSFDHLSELKVNLLESSDPVSTTLQTSLHLNNINFKQLQRLVIEYGSSSSNDVFNNLLHRASNLEFLSICRRETPIIHAINKDILKQLKELSIEYDDYWTDDWNQRSLVPENEILDMCSSELLAFRTESDLTRLNMNYSLFPNLQELSIRNNRNPAIIDIITKFENLQRIHLDLYDIGSDWISKYSTIPLTTQFMNKLLSLKQLECVDFGISELELPKLMKLIANSLIIHNKKKLKIYIWSHLGSDDPNDDIHIDFELFVNTLKYILSEDFMFMFGADDMRRTQELRIKHWLSGLDEKQFWMQCCGVTGYIEDHMFVVTNKGCKMNGYQKKWIFNY